MADTTVDGEPTISAHVISFWGGFGTIAMLAGQTVGGPMSDRIGRRSVKSAPERQFFSSR